MTLVLDQTEWDGDQLWSASAKDLESQVRNVLEHAVDGYRRRLRVYESLRNLNEVVGTQYGDRVLYELIQNAHDAHRDDDPGRIAVRLVIRSETDGTLYVANGGSGFRRKDVEAIKNLATTAKEIGEGIGNKGLGFRSIEALTDDVRIFSRRGRSESGRFDGYCFRFATVAEIGNLLRGYGIDAATARKVAGTVPRYLVPCRWLSHRATWRRTRAEATQAPSSYPCVRRRRSNWRHAKSSRSPNSTCPFSCFWTASRNFGLTWRRRRGRSSGAG